MTNDLAVKQSADLATTGSSGIGIAGVEGFDMTDLPMPFVKLVHGTSRNVELASGGKAQPGTWFHTSKKEAKENMDVVFFYAKKGEFPDMPKHPEVMIPGVRVLAVDLGDLDSPFAMQFTKGGYWAYKRLLAAMKSYNVSKLYERIVFLSSKTVESQAGDEFLVPTMDLSDPLTESDLEKVARVAEKFGGVIDQVVEEEHEVATEEEIPLPEEETQPKKTARVQSKYFKCPICGNMGAETGSTHKKACPNYRAGATSTVKEPEEKTVTETLDGLDLGGTL